MDYLKICTEQLFYGKIHIPQKCLDKQRQKELERCLWLKNNYAKNSFILLCFLLLPVCKDSKHLLGDSSCSLAFLSQVLSLILEMVSPTMYLFMKGMLCLMLSCVWIWLAGIWLTTSWRSSRSVATPLWQQVSPSDFLYCENPHISLGNSLIFSSIVLIQSLI